MFDWTLCLITSQAAVLDENNSSETKQQTLEAPIIQIWKLSSHQDYDVQLLDTK